MATVEINDAVFCQAHLKEICDECEVDLREENDAFYGFDATDRNALECPPTNFSDAGEYCCVQHESPKTPKWCAGRNGRITLRPQVRRRWFEWHS
ncbi:hypothetical protein BKA59DRAFT_521237 [Fusarium tricinctum]|uniref:Uncharacterized protein n=1 Tax=Fusarium tricinctum TaxID=61284 RepID=A0A8K0S1T8_9HYPO|nr:hypothetical protein BKA59DRAFT_521237 [Fusarium tricinctum]